MYAVDINGSLLEGYPLDLGSALVGSIVFNDLTGDGLENMVAGTSAGKIFAYGDNSLLQYGDIPGYFQFREKLCAFLENGKPEEYFITNGVTQALALFCRYDFLLFIRNI